MLNYSDGYLLYDLTARKNGRCVVTLPYDDGFKVLVDGIEVKKEKTMDFLLGFKVDKGTHRIEISYVPEGFMPGALLSALGIILFISVIVKFEIVDKKKST